MRPLIGSEFVVPASQVLPAPARPPRRAASVGLDATHRPQPCREPPTVWTLADREPDQPARAKVIAAKPPQHVPRVRVRLQRRGSNQARQEADLRTLVPPSAVRNQAWPAGSRGHLPVSVCVGSAVPTTRERHHPRRDIGGHRAGLDQVVDTMSAPSGIPCEPQLRDLGVGCLAKLFRQQSAQVVKVIGSAVMFVAMPPVVRPASGRHQHRSARHGHSWRHRTRRRGDEVASQTRHSVLGTVPPVSPIGSVCPNRVV